MPAIICTRRCRVAGRPAVPEAGALTLVLLVVLAMFCQMSLLEQIGYQRRQHV